MWWIPCPLLAYLFGINAGPEHLNGQNFREAPMGIMILIGVADFMLLLLVVAFLLKLIQLRKNCVRYLQTAFLFVAFIGACIVCSSVTIRVEMRWVYVSYGAALLFLSWMYGVLIDGEAQRGHWMQGIPFLAMFTAYVVLMLPVENYYRGLFPNLRSITIPWQRKPTASTEMRFSGKPCISSGIILKWKSLRKSISSVCLTASAGRTA